MPRGKFSLLKEMNELLDQHPAWYETMLLNHDIDSPSVVWVQEQMAEALGMDVDSKLFGEYFLWLWDCTPHAEPTEAYPMLWQRGLIQQNVKCRALHTCEECGMAFAQESNRAIQARRRDGYPMVGTVHHIDMDKKNCAMNNLVFLCQSCHYRIHIDDWTPGKPLPKRWHNRPAQWVLSRNLPYKPNPQRSLFVVDMPLKSFVKQPVQPIQKEGILDGFE
jgi:hypothetical protein